jgi:cytochrome b
MRSRSAWFTADEPTVPVWDRFVRLFHWGSAGLVLLAYLTTDDARGLHEFAGYAVLVLVATRVVWGIVGTRHALFISFIAGPRAVLRYLMLLRAGRAPRHLGHNPAGGAMIMALLILLTIVAGSGWLSQTDAWFGVPWVDRLHHVSAHLLLGLIALHVAGVIVSSWLHRENLVLAMITGRKPIGSGMGSEFEDERRTTAIAPRGPY